jgi:ParB family chromosome partitioning protein
LPTDTSGGATDLDDGASPNGEAGSASGAESAASTGLGSGVAALPIEAVRPNPYQPRRHFDDEGLDELRRSIEAVGVLQPILVRPVADGYELVAGERRWRAAQRAGLRTIPALIRPTEDLSSLVQAVVENVQRADLNPIEEAAAYQQLLRDFTLTQEEVAARVGRSRSAVANTLRLLQLAPELQRLILEGELTAGHGRALLSTEDEAWRDELATRAVEDSLSVRELEELVRRGRPSTAPSTRDGPGTTKLPALLELEQLLADRLETRVRVELGRKRGRIEIEFADLEDLERIFLAIS